MGMVPRTGEAFDLLQVILMILCGMTLPAGHVELIELFCDGPRDPVHIFVML